MRVGRYALVGSALLATAIQLSAGTAEANYSVPIWIWVGGGSADLACEATELECVISGYVNDLTVPITFSVDGKTIATKLATPNRDAGEASVAWIPPKAGIYTLTVQQGAASDSRSIRIIDNNSLEALNKRITSRLTSGSANNKVGG